MLLLKGLLLISRSLKMKISKLGNMAKVNFMGMIHLKNIFTMFKMVNVLCVENHI